MLKNYIKIAYRNLLKNKVFSLINICGLALGMMACLLILQYVVHELSYDKFHEHGQDIYRVVNDRYQNGKLIQHGTITYSAVGPYMKEDFAEVIRVARIFTPGSMVIGHQNKQFSRETMIMTDNDFLQMFTYPFIAGDPSGALEKPNQVVLTQSLCDKLFDTENKNYHDVIGKTIYLNDRESLFQIVGVMEDVPANSHLHFAMLGSFSTLYETSGWSGADNSWLTSDFWHYVQLRAGVDHKTLDKKLEDFSHRHLKGEEVTGSEEKFYLQPLYEAHLYSDLEYEIGVIGNGRTVWTMFIVACFILAIGWMNYVNLSTARSMERAGEVGVRKVMGAHKKHLIQQFLTESFLVNVMAIILAVTLVQIFQPVFNSVIAEPLSLWTLLEQELFSFNVALLFLIILLGGALVAGFYPAFVLSSFSPVKVLKGKYAHSKSGNFLRKGLVVFQFTTSVALIIGLIIVQQQMKYTSEKDLGLNVDQKLIISGPILTNWDSTFIDRVNSFKNTLKEHGYIKGTTSSSRTPGQNPGRFFNVRREGTDEGTYFTMANIGVDYDFINVYDIDLLYGRNFTINDHDPDWDNLNTILVSESALDMLGFQNAQAAVGEAIMIYDKRWEVVGVIKDFHQKSLKHAKEPMVLLPTYSTGNPISVELAASDIQNTVQWIEGEYKRFFPGNPFEYFFLDHQFEQLYRAESLFSKVFGLFTSLAIVVACLGLYGLSSFNITQRIKEIGVRKVLGASLVSILRLLSKEFVLLTTIASILAAPAAFLGMKLWLDNFVYRIDLAWWFFLIPVAVMMVITLITISTQIIKAALSNPVEALRYE
ncbi:ABC transporter permease [Fulvivirgaceae bacterium BMA10]|uniref:ABC transporter permease n=1 Tax=Splendidivirga corallicola TaxID=3051826 RepID=A0ABT8KZ97_9BACT|nr:ABC transporter permease [Fulvivirgaceae bacterium BMA10]